MTAPTQEQLDDFARRLRSFEAELEALKQQAVAAAPAPAPTAPVAPPRVAEGPLAHVQRLLDAGDVGAAVKELERRRARALDARSVPELQALLALARAASSTPSAPVAAAGSAQRLAYAIEQNLRFLGASAQPAAPPAPEPVAPPAGTASRPRQLGEPAPAGEQPRRPRPDLREAFARMDSAELLQALAQLELMRAEAVANGSLTGLSEILDVLRFVPDVSTGEVRAATYALATRARDDRKVLSRQKPGRAPVPLSEPTPTAPDVLQPVPSDQLLAVLERRRTDAAAKRSEAELRELLAAVRRALAAATAEDRPGVQALAERVAADIDALQRRQAVAPPAPTPSAQPVPPSPWRQGRELPQIRLPEVELADLLGARALALAGGVVTLLGIVFFFVLAVDRGWVGPEARVALGAAAALLVFLTGLELHRRYGETYASLAAVGAGLAGGYATLLSAAALYDLVPDYVALAVAAAIAAVGVVTSLVWRSQIVAGLGLIGAMLVPVAVVFQGGLSPLGTTFVAVVYAATAVVALQLRWRGLLVAGAVASAPQIVALVLRSEYHSQAPGRIVALAAAFSLLYAVSGIVYHLRSGAESLDPLATALTSAGAVLMALAARRLFGTREADGIALLATAGCYGLAAAAFFTRRATRDLSALLAAIAFVLGGFGFAALLSGQPLVYAWAAETAALAWLARRTREPRFQVWAAVYCVLCAGHVLVLDAPPRSLFVETAHPASQAAAALAAALAAAVFGFYARPWPGLAEQARSLLAPLDALVAIFHAYAHQLRSASYWLAGSLATLALSLAAIALFSDFDWSFVAVTAIWSLVGLGIAAAGVRVNVRQLRLGAAVWFLVVTSAVVLTSGPLASGPRWWSFLVLATVLFAAGLACELLDPDAGARTMDAAAYAATAAIVLGAVATAGLLGGQPLAWTWAAEAVGLALGARLLRAPHLQALAAAPLGLALVHALAFDTPPRQLFTDTAHPAHGTVTAVAIAAAAAAIAVLARPWTDGVRTYRDLGNPMAALARNQAVVRIAAAALGGLVALYALSLATLALFASFDWGWVALAALWSGLALAVLFAGLRVGSAGLQLGGLVSLATATAVVVAEGALVLDSTPRCVAFAVVAAALLVAGLAYVWRIERAGLEPVTVGATLVSLALSCYAIGTLLDGKTGVVDRQGAALLGLAFLYGSIAAMFLRRPGCRDLATMFWGIALVLAAVADAMLLDGTYAVLGWAVAGAALAWLSTRVHEPRFLLGSVAYLVLALGRAVIFEAPPSHLFSAQVDPGSGAGAILAVAVAVAAAAAFARDEPAVPARYRSLAWWLAGVLAVYGVSLLILQLAESVFDASLQTEYQRGHTAVSAFWGALGLVLLYLGLTRWRSLRLAGFALFAVSLGKIFLYDLTSLSSVGRALSFLAVGAVLLLGGFFYQRLSAGKSDVRDAAADA